MLTRRTLLQGVLSLAALGPLKGVTPEPRTVRRYTGVAAVEDVRVDENGLAYVEESRISPLAALLRDTA